MVAVSLKKKKEAPPVFGPPHHPHLPADKLRDARLTPDHVALAIEAGSMHSIADAHAEVNHVEDHLQDRSDDAGRAGCADDDERPAILKDDGRRHTGGAPLARRDGVAVAGERVEIDHRVVIHETQARCDHAGGTAEGMGESDAVARPIHHCNVGGVGRLAGCVGDGDRFTPLYPFAPDRRPLFRRHPGQRHIGEAGIGHVGVAVGKGSLHRHGDAVDILRRVVTQGGKVVWSWSQLGGPSRASRLEINRSPTPDQTITGEKCSYIIEGAIPLAELGLKPHDSTSGFRCYRRAVLEGIPLDSIKSEGYSFLEEVLFRSQHAGFRAAEVPIVFRDRTGGSSKISRSEIFKAVWTVLRLAFCA